MMSFTGNIDQIKQYLWKFDKQTIYDIEIKKHRNKRSLNANSYCWEIISKIANVLRLSKEEVYVQMLKDYGQSMKIPTKVNEELNGYFKYYEYLGKGKLNNSIVDWYIVYKGSSEYDTKEMSILIDGIVQEAKALEIETLTPNELRMLKEEWR